MIVPSYAKINWMLEVVGPRPDGYQEIRTVLQTIDLADRLEFIVAESDIAIECDHPSVPANERNLVYRAAVMLREATGVRQGVRIRIEKRIPVAAGLGGGSSNAAVTLLTLARVWKLRLSAAQMLALGARLGSDVPFFFYGGTALGIGRGEEVYPLPEVVAPYLLLVVPAVEVSTAWAYGQLTKPTRKSNIPVCCATIFRACHEGDRAGARILGAAGNDLEAVVSEHFPAVGKMCAKLKATRAQVVRMSGSGPALVAVFDSEEALVEAQTRVSGPGVRVWRTRTVGRKEYSERVGLGSNGRAGE